MAVTVRAFIYVNDEFEDNSRVVYFDDIDPLTIEYKFSVRHQEASFHFYKEDDSNGFSQGFTVFDRGLMSFKIMENKAREKEDDDAVVIER